MRVTMLVSVLGASVFGLSPGGGEAPLPTQAADRECVQISGKQIGALPLIIRVGEEKLQFRGWEATDVTATEWVGFKLEGSPRVSFTVKAGEQEFESTGAGWNNPHGVVGPKVQGIDAITFCVEKSAPWVAQAEPAQVTAGDYD